MRCGVMWYDVMRWLRADIRTRNVLTLVETKVHLWQMNCSFKVWRLAYLRFPSRLCKKCIRNCSCLSAKQTSVLHFASFQKVSKLTSSTSCNFSQGFQLSIWLRLGLSGVSCSHPTCTFGAGLRRNRWPSRFHSPTSSSSLFWARARKSALLNSWAAKHTAKLLIPLGAMPHQQNTGHQNQAFSSFLRLFRASFSVLQLASVPWRKGFESLGHNFAYLHCQ